jgi:uncharacterized membrane protein YgcG
MPVLFTERDDTMAVSQLISRHALLAFCAPCLLAGCAPLTVASIPDASVIQVQGGQAIAPNCDAMQQPEPMGLHDGPLSITSRPSIAFGCATYGDLAKMIVNPRDLVTPRPYPGQSAATAGAAVQRYYSGTVTPLLSNADTSNVGSGSSAGNSPSTGSSTGSQGTGAGSGGGGTQ